jgi:hypothetical protein
VNGVLLRRWLRFLLLCLGIAVVVDLVLIAASPVWRDNLLLRTHQVQATVTGVTDVTPSASCRLHHHIELRWTHDGDQRTGFLDGCGLTKPAEGTVLTVWAGGSDEVLTGPPQSIPLYELGLVALAATGLTAWRTIRLRRRPTAVGPKEPSATA